MCIRDRLLIHRRSFLILATATAPGWACRRGAFSPPPPPGVQPSPFAVTPPLHPDALARFVDPLPILPTLAPAGTRPDPQDPTKRLPYYRVAMTEIEAREHRDLPPTRFWGYGGRFPGPTFEARSGRGILVEWVNGLPARHILPIDHTLCGAGVDRPDVRAVVHVHGARVPAESDGYPESWTTPGQSLVYHYPNHQDATTLWYHDHAMGIERLNQYAGLLGFVADQVGSEQAGVLVETFDSHRVVVVPERGRVLMIRVVIDERLPRRGPALRIAIALRGDPGAVYVDHRADVRAVDASAAECVIDRENVSGGEPVDPLDEDAAPAARLERGAREATAVSPKPGGRQVAVHPGFDLGHGDAVVRQPVGRVLRVPAGPRGRQRGQDRQRIDETGQCIRVQRRRHRERGRLYPRRRWGRKRATAAGPTRGCRRGENQEAPTVNQK